MTEIEKYPAPPIPGWLQGVLPTPEFQIRFLKADKSEHWVSNVGPQTHALLCPYDEVLIGGRRGGSKSAALIAWFAMGDMNLAEDDPARYSFLNEPSFRGLILRHEYQALGDFVDEAADFFRPFGCKPKDDPVVFEFKSGAKIFTNHLGTKEAYEKYRGHGITKIGIEELVQIPEERWYVKLFGSLRGKKQIRVHNGKTYPALRCQIMSTTNPDGPGHVWVKNRFVRVQGPAGPIPWNTPMVDPFSRMTRLFLPMALADNPYLRENRQYTSMLMAQDEVTRKQWMDGDWDAGSGQYFTEFRPAGPVGGEVEKYPWARHVVDPVELKPWWFRFGGCDIGFEHLTVAQKACRNERDGRIHVYDELALRHVGSYEIGVELAKWWLPDLEFLPDKQITIALSPDAFSKTDATRTRAEQIADGIKAVLGPYGSFLLRYNDDERTAMGRDPKMAQMMFDRRKGEMARGQLCIAIKAAQNDRISGWSYLHELLRFRPIMQETQDELKVRLQGTFERAGVEAYEKELAASKGSGAEILPKMALWRKCSEAIRGLTEAMHDEPPKAEDVRKWDSVDGVGGDDGLDALRYLCMSFKEVATVVPKSYWVNEQISNAQQEQVANFGHEITDQTRLAMIAACQSGRYEKANHSTVKSFSLPRASSSRHRLN